MVNFEVGKSRKLAVSEIFKRDIRAAHFAIDNNERTTADGPRSNRQKTRDHFVTAETAAADIDDGIKRKFFRVSLNKIDIISEPQVAKRSSFDGHLNVKLKRSLVHDAL